MITFYPTYVYVGFTDVDENTVTVNQFNVNFNVLDSEPAKCDGLLERNSNEVIQSSSGNCSTICVPSSSNLPPIFILNLDRAKVIDSAELLSINTNNYSVLRVCFRIGGRKHWLNLWLRGFLTHKLTECQQVLLLIVQIVHIFVSVTPSSLNTIYFLKL